MPEDRPFHVLNAGYAWPADVLRQIEIGEIGLFFGAGTLLARLKKDGIRSDADRAIALMSVAYSRPVSRDLLLHFEAASAHWQRGDKAVANLRLVFAGLPLLEHPSDAYRMQLAEYLLDEGMSPATLVRELGLEEPISEVKKYDQDQPRVPAGNGVQSGRWGSVEGTFVVEDTSPSPPPDRSKEAPDVPAAAVVAPVAALEAAETGSTLGTLASGLFEATAAAGEFLAGLATLAGSIGTGVVLGAVVIPSPNNVTTEGALPSDPDLHYSLNGEDGVLRLTRAVDNEPVAIAYRGHDGIFFESETGIPIARDVGGSVVFDAASLANVAPAVQTPARTDAKSGAKADTEQNSPQLCPAPSKDVPNWASKRAIAYQMQISALNNPQRGPLPKGMAVSLINPATGRRVVYDDCRDSDGTMIEAKGPGYAKLLQYNYFSEQVLPKRWANQAGRQISASGGRQVDWYFAEDAAATRARQVFNKAPDLSRIKVHVIPAVIK